jgi:hypothetical protein
MLTFLFLILLVALLVAAIYVFLSPVWDDRGRMKFTYKWKRSIPFLLGSFALCVLVGSFTTIDSGNVGVVKRWGEAVRQITPETLKLRMIEKWDGHLPQIVSGAGTVPMMDLLAASGKK